MRPDLFALSAGRGMDRAPDGLLVTTGSQQAFDLLARVLVQPGDAVLSRLPRK